MNIAFNNDWLFTEDYDSGFDNAASAHSKRDTL